MHSTDLNIAIERLARTAPDEYRALLTALAIYHSTLALQIVDADSDRVLLLQGGARQLAHLLRTLAAPFNAPPTAEELLHQP